jgi:phenylalanine-4-hydroxylase
MITSAPARPQATASARPMRRDPPVMRIVFSPSGLMLTHPPSDDILTSEQSLTKSPGFGGFLTGRFHRDNILREESGMTATPDQTVLDPAHDVDFSDEQHEIWRALFARQLPQVEKYACREYLQGSENLQLPPDRIPSVQWLNERIEPRTGWKTLRTKVRYSDAIQWYNHFARREFLITDYVRTADELDFTPEPDMFHDVYGHLPYFTLRPYVELQEMFAPAFHRAQTEEQRENVKRLAWFSTEFGLIRQGGELRVFGTGLISSKGEMEHVLGGKTPLLPFKAETIVNFDKAIWSYNEQLFYFESLAALKAELQGYFETL